jgi:hypothetical protein
MSFIATAALDAALDYIGTNADELWLVEGYTNGESYAAAQAKQVASTGTFTLAAAGAANATGEVGRSRVIATGTAMGNASASATGTLSYVLVDTGGTAVLAEGVEASGQDITSGNPVVAGEITFRLYYSTA